MGSIHLFVLVLLVLNGAIFLAEFQGWHAFTGVENAGWIKGRFHLMELLQFFVIELHGHLPNLLNAHAMLTGDATTHFHTQLQNGAAEGFRLLKLARYVG